MNSADNNYFNLKKYLFFALGAELIFVASTLLMAGLSDQLFTRFPQLLMATKEAMAGISQKVVDTTAIGMTGKIFVNNTLIALMPLIIFLFHILPVRLIKIVAIYLSLTIGLFIYVTNAVVVGLGFGMLAMEMQVSYLTLLAISMIHGSFELFAVAGGSLFALYYLKLMGSKLSQGGLTSQLASARRLLRKLIPLLIILLAVAAVIEVYLTSPLALKLIAG